MRAQGVRRRNFKLDVMLASTLEAADVDELAELGPAVVFDKLADHSLERYAVQLVLGLLVAHRARSGVALTRLGISFAL